MNENIKLFGFTLLRNAIKYDYCFEESLHSLSSLVEYTYLALGKGEDETEKRVLELPKIKIINTVWDEKLRDSGLILSQQTNIALQELRKAEENNSNAWAIYLQADEVIHENDLELIKNDIQKANEGGFNAVSFRYNHFWLNHNTLTVGKKWYPIEIRAIKLHSNIQSVKDAQGFEGQTKIFQSNAFIYHYGHVREKKLYNLKKADFHKLYNADENLMKAQKKEERKYNQGIFLDYFGTHPQIMKSRIMRFGDIFHLSKRDEIWIVGNREQFDTHFINRISGSKINWIDSVTECPSKNRTKDLVIFEPNWWQKIVFPSKVQQRPESKLGPNWTKEHILTLKLSEKYIGVE